MLGTICQPWLFVCLAVGFGIVAYFASGENVPRAIIGGLAFAGLREARASRMPAAERPDSAASRNGRSR